MRTRVPRPQAITRLNLTPIIDVALVLVIILLVTAPMLSVADLPVDLPEAHTRGLETRRNISITLGTGGAVVGIDDAVMPREQLRAALVERLSVEGDAGVLVVIRADAGLPYAQVRSALEDARQAGARELAIATRQVPEGTK
jgi:biopolymer transport protein TolR